MIGLSCFVLAVLASPFKSKLRLEAENAVLRRHPFTANCSSWGLRSHSRASPSTWSSGGCHLRSQGWRTFLHNHAPDIAAMDLFVVPTIGVDLLYACIIVRLDRRELVWIDVTAHPTDEWVARPEAFPWNEAPRYMIRDRDRIYGAVVTRRLRAMGIRDKPIAPAERLIGSVWRECLDYIIVLGEAHLRLILKSYARTLSTRMRFSVHTGCGWRDISEAAIGV
jgi:hypothetical protein